jgi:hypothetical protein
MARPSLRTIIAAALLFALPAQAKTIWVSPSGNDSNAGGQTSPLRTIAKANALVLPGDLVRIMPGSYSEFPNPAAAATGGMRFTYMGTTTGADPMKDTLSRATIVLPSGSLSKSYVTIKGVRVAGNLGCTESGDRDSILDVTADGDFDHQGGDYDIYARDVFKGTKFNLNKNTLGSSDGVQIYGCDFRYVGQNENAGDHNWLVWNADSTVEMFNRRLITVEAGLPIEFGGEWHFDDRNRVSRGNHTVIKLNRGTPNMWRWRSDQSVDIGCFGNRMDCDTILVTGSSPAESNFLFSSSANCGQQTYLPQCVGAWNCTMDSCLINASAVSGIVHMNWQGGMTGWTITNCVLATTGEAVLAFDVHQSRITNCTLAGAPVVSWKDSYGRPIWGSGDMTFANNIVCSWGNGCITLDPAMLVSGALGVNKNLYWGCGSVPPWPVDASSIYGDPKFVNASKGMSFDPHLLTGSPALPLGAGAYSGTPAGDTVAPAQIVDLR